MKQQGIGNDTTYPLRINMLGHIEFAGYSTITGAVC